MPTSKSHVITPLNNGCSRMTFVSQVQCVFCEVVAEFLITVYTIFRHNSIIGRCCTRVLMITAVVFRTKKEKGTFADDTAILASHADPRTAAQHLQLHLNLTQDWLKKWRIKINETKSVHVTSTLRKGRSQSTNVEIPIAAVTKYIGMH